MDQIVSGLYRETFSTSAERKAKGTELELRVDVDGERPMNVVSGEVYRNLDAICKHLCSFRFEGVRKIGTQANEILIVGTYGKFDPSPGAFKDIDVTIRLDQRPLEAIVRCTTSQGASSRYCCKFVSRYFRSVELEHDYEVGVVPIKPYETNDLPSPAPHRSHPITISNAFAEAGIELQIVKEKRSSVPHPKGTPDGAVWTDSELRDALAKHFTTVRDTPQWRVWLLSADEYVMSNINGITIDREAEKRRGCAVFQDATGWRSIEQKRMRLFIYVHELGHCFNLHHPWKKLQPDSVEWTEGRATLSWMNCPWLYYSSEDSHGEEAFWEAFHFQFSDAEVMHLRHGFRNDVIFGSNACVGNRAHGSRLN